MNVNVSKNPFNWAGNKYRYIEDINTVVKSKKYINTYDVFMGSGNIITNLHSQSNNFIGNDIIPLLPNLYNYIASELYNYDIEELKSIVDTWSRFSDKKFYYDFRDHWNNKYLSNKYDKMFVYETAILLKMCSNSMVRFNKTKGYFNQGFRGLGGNKKEFFTERSLNKIVKDLNIFKMKLQNKTFEFYNKDFRFILDKVNKDDLVILDPPYILSEGMYGNDFTGKDDQAILDFLENTKADFILFNYLESGDRVNYGLQSFLENNKHLTIKEISSSNATGQSRKNIKKVSELLITNVN